MQLEKDNTYGSTAKGEGCHMMEATQHGVEAAIAKNEVAHLNAKRIQDEVEDVKHELREEEMMPMFNNCGGFGGGGMATGLMFGLLASGGLWGNRGRDCGDGHGCHDTIEIIRDNHDGVLSIKDQMNCNALRECEARHADAMAFQKGLDSNKLATVEVACKLEKDMACGFAAISDKLCNIEKDCLKNELCERNEKIEELKAKLREQTNTAAILAAISGISTTATTATTA